MIQSGLLSEEDRKALAHDASSPCWVTRRANALVPLDAGWSCQQVANAFLLDDDTVRGWASSLNKAGSKASPANPRFQSVFLIGSQIAWRSRQHRNGGFLGVPPIVQENECIGLPREPMRQRDIASKRDQLLTIFFAEEATLNHVGTRIFKKFVPAFQ